jgi:Cysteine-rich secretory protein family
MTMQPTAHDQFMLELLNRARLNPQNEANQFLRGNLNEGLPGPVIAQAAKQPLAFNPKLAQAANDHCQWMIKNNTFSHRGVDGTRVAHRTTRAGYRWNSLGENLGLRITPGRLNLKEEMAQHHQNLFVDSTISNRSHRINMLKEDYKEAGVATATSVSGRNNNTLVCHNFGRDGNIDSFLTGVVYTDQVQRDNFYTVGEGIANVTVQATGKNGYTYTAKSMDAGGYSLRLPAGTYEVTFKGNFQGHGSVATSVNRTVTIGDRNVKLDYVPEKSNIALQQQAPVAAAIPAPATAVPSLTLALAVMTLALR